MLFFEGSMLFWNIAFKVLCKNLRIQLYKSNVLKICLNLYILTEIAISSIMYWVNYSKAIFFESFYGPVTKRFETRCCYLKRDRNCLLIFFF